MLKPQYFISAVSLNLVIVLNFKNALWRKYKLKFRGRKKIKSEVSELHKWIKAPATKDDSLGSVLESSWWGFMTPETRSLTFIHVPQCTFPPSNK